MLSPCILLFCNIAVNNNGNCIALFTSLFSYKLYQHSSAVQKSSQIIILYQSPNSESQEFKSKSSFPTTNFDIAVLFMCACLDNSDTPWRQHVTACKQKTNQSEMLSACQLFLFILADFGLVDIYLEGGVIKRGREEEFNWMEEVSKTSEIAFSF